MQLSASLVLLAIVIEQVTEILKQAIPAIRPEYSRVTSIAISVVVCISTQMGVLGELGVTVAHPIVDYIITGTLISRGSNFLHDLLATAGLIVNNRLK